MKNNDRPKTKGQRPKARYRGEKRCRSAGLKIFFILAIFGFCSFSAASYASAVKIRQDRKGNYLFYLDDRDCAPTIIRGVIYSPVPVGEGYGYNFFADKSKPWLYDGKLMKALGINTVRIYSAGEDLEKVKEFIRDMYDKFGIHTIVSDWLGLWDHPPANYTDQKFREETKARVLRIVEALKDEEGVIIWLLGNENNYTFSGKIGFWTSEEIEKIKDVPEKIAKKAEIYYSFVDEIAKEIKKIDKVHPVALGNGEESFLDIAAKVCRNIDLLGVISYRGKNFGNLFRNIKKNFDKPVFISEFGADAYNAYTAKVDEDAQADFLLSQWEDLYANSALSDKKEEGNCIGGTIFEWTDEWWKHNEGYASGWGVHNKEAGWSQGAYYYDIKAEGNLNMNEEWFGMLSIEDEKENGINKRALRKSFYALKGFFACISDESCSYEVIF